jgi:ABC-2 type transport system permease protein
MAITMPMWFLSGAFLPTSTLPGWLYPVSVFNPLTYAVNGVRDIMLKGVITPMAFLTDTVILLAFIIVSIALSFIMFKNKIG